MNNDGNICCEVGEGEKLKVNTNMRNLSPMLPSSSKCQNSAHHFCTFLEEIKYIMILGHLFAFFLCGQSKLANQFYTRFSDLSSLSLFICQHLSNANHGNFSNKVQLCLSFHRWLLEAKLQGKANKKQTFPFISFLRSYCSFLSVATFIIL